MSNKFSEAIWGGIGGAIVGALITVLFTGYFSTIDREANVKVKEQILEATALAQEEIRQARAREAEHLLTAINRAESASLRAENARETATRMLDSLKKQQEIVNQIVKGVEDKAGNSAEDLSKALLPRVLEEIENQIAPGSVIAFNRTNCPEGWGEFESARGRVILGVGNGENLTSRGLLDIGGAEDHLISVSHLPEHSHYVGAGWYQGLSQGQSIHLADSSGEMGAGVSTSNVIKGREKQQGRFSVMPPFVALKYCIRL